MLVYRYVFALEQGMKDAQGLVFYHNNPVFLPTRSI